MLEENLCWFDLLSQPLSKGIYLLLYIPPLSILYGVKTFEVSTTCSSKNFTTGSQITRIMYACKRKIVGSRGRCDVANIDYLNAGEPCMHESMCVCVCVCVFRILSC